MKILIVDDYEENRYLLEVLLKKGKYDVTGAANGAEALEKLKEVPFDLIVSDILMPVMDGFQLCRKVKADPALAHIPFIVYTATYTGPQDEEFALKIGADRFILKPCEPEVFLKAVQEVMEGAERNNLPPEPGAEPEEEVLKLYNERLVRKLEQKMLQLEEEIEKRRETEEILRASEEKYRILVENAGEAVFVAQDGMLKFVNRKTEELSGYTPEELLSAPFDTFIHPEDRAFVLDRHVERAQGIEVPTDYTFRVLHKSGEVRWAELNAVAVDWQGTPATLNFLRDITEQKRAETEKAKLQMQLAQAQKLESVGRLAGGVAHDFNNMLGVIIGHAELAMDQLDRAHPVHADLTEIHKAARRSAELTNQLLAFARKQIVSPKVIDLNDNITGMLKMLRRLIGEDIDLVWKPGASLWPVKMDPVQIHQILANLCVNARDAIAGVGKLTIETGNVIIDEDYCAAHAEAVPGAHVMLAVSDTGRGMGKEALENLFEPFFTTKEVGEGTGLGLSTVYGIVKQNNGFINVYSEPGQGATFKIYFPRTRESLKTEEPTEPKVIPRGSETVLLVEDEASILSLGKAVLERCGYTVLGARTPREALAVAGEHEGPIHLLVTDVVMPEMNGKELTARVKELIPGIKVLYMSGYTSNAIIHRGVFEEDVHFLPKPFSVSSLAEKVREILDR